MLNMFLKILFLQTKNYLKTNYNTLDKNINFKIYCSITFFPLKYFEY